MSKEAAIYCEYIFPIKDYCTVTKRSEVLFEWGLSIFISAGLYYFAYSDLDKNDLKNISSIIVNCLAILIGFSVTCLTILASASDSNIADLKKSVTERYISDRPITLYRLLIINFIFLLLLELLNLLLNFIFIAIVGLESFSEYISVIYGFITVLTMTIFLLNVRNITNFYFVLTR